ncbi:MAG: ERF family protein [Agathobacter sp.]
MNNQETQLNIYQKLAKIRKPVEVIKKNKKGYGYTYVTEDEILAKITGLMDKYGVSLIPSIVRGSTQVTPYHYLKTKADKTGKVYEEHCNDMLIQADMEWAWVDNDNPDSKITVPWVLVGQQAELSQSFGSALTYASRYFMLKYFNVATSDEDPEAFYLKKKEAEQHEELMIVEGIVNNIHEFVEKHLSVKPDDRDEIIKLIKKLAKSANYFDIKEVAVATKVYEALTEKFTTEEDK